MILPPERGYGSQGQKKKFMLTIFSGIPAEVKYIIQQRSVSTEIAPSNIEYQ
jgi:hypothetical protein